MGAIKYGQRSVIKIGGSVLTNKESYKEQAIKIKEFLEKDGIERLYVVTSAMKGKTDEVLENLTKEHPSLMKILKNALNGAPEDEVDIRIRKNLVDFLLEPERESTTFLARDLRELGIGVSFLVQGRNYPIIANDKYLCAKIDIEKSKEKFLEISNKIKNKVVAVVGFGAENYKEEPVLLGRNSSDLIACVLGLLDDKVKTVIYRKDQDGIYKNFGTDNQELVKESSFSNLDWNYVGKVLHKEIANYIGNFDIVVENQNRTIGSSGTLIRNSKEKYLNQQK